MVTNYIQPIIDKKLPRSNTARQQAGLAGRGKAAGRMETLSRETRSQTSGEDRVRVIFGSSCLIDVPVCCAAIPGQEFVDPLDGIFGDPCQHVGEPRLQINIVHLRSDDQAVHDRGSLASAIEPAEQP